MSRADKKVQSIEKKKNDVKPDENKNENKPDKQVKTAKEAVKKKESSSGKRYLFYLLCIVAAGVIGMIIALVKFFGSERVQRNASASLEFTYDGAAQNRTPSGELFSIDAIYEAKVIDGALVRSGMNEKYNAEAIKNSLEVTGTYPGDVIDQIKDYDSLYNFSESRSISIDNYYPTIYTVKLYDDFDTSISESDLDMLVNAIAEQYKEYFRKEYVYAFDMSDANALFEHTQYDYAQRVKVIKNKLQMLEEYSSEMYLLDTGFRINGKTFNDILLKCREIENDSLSKAEASIMIDVLTATDDSEERLRNQYEYEIRLLENEQKFKKENLEEINKLIDSYHKDNILYIGSGDSLVKVDSNSKATYEKLVDEKRELSERLVEIGSEIGRYNEYLNDLNNKTASVDAKKKENIKKELDSISEKVIEQQNLFKELIEAYNNTIISEDAVVVTKLRFSDSKLFSVSFVLAVVKCAAPLCIIVMILCCIHAAFLEIRKFKKQSSTV